MRKTITLSLFVLSTLVYGQEYNYKPTWKKGDTKKISVTQVQKKYENDKLIENETTYNTASVKVLSENETTYTLEIQLENQALRSAILFYEKAGEELKAYKNLKLIYAVNKETAETELLNWKEAQKFMLESVGQITKLMKKKAPSSSSFMNLIFTPLLETFKSKQNIEEYMKSTIGYLVLPFNKHFKLNETIKTIENTTNPLNPAQELSATTLLTLTNVNTNNKTCTINQEVILDLSQFIAMIKDMMQKMSKSFGVNDSITAIKSKEMDDFEMDITTTQSIIFNYESAWVTQMTTTSIISGTDPQKGTKNKTEVITTTRVE
jgi:hypothetical protein